MGKKEEKQLLEVVGSGGSAGDKDKLLKLLYPKQKPAQAAAALEREDIKQLRLTVNVSGTIDLNITRAECGSTPLTLACLNGHLELASILLQHDAEVNAQDLNGNTGLHWAAFHDRHDFVELLNKAKVKPNNANKDGETPLHFAVQNLRVGRPQTMVRLLQGGALANQKNNAGDTPLTLAARLNKIDAVSLLVDACQQLTSDPKPLIEAARTGRVELSEVLLDCGFDPNGLDHVSGARPLHEAVQYCRPAICKLLVEFGADSMMTDAKGLTAESLARMLPGGRGPEYLRIFDKGREQIPRLARVDREREQKVADAKAKEVTQKMPLLQMYTQWTRNCRPYRSRSSRDDLVFNLFVNNSTDSRYVIPRGRNNWVLFDFGSKFIINGVQLVGWQSPETIKNFQVLSGESVNGPWKLARAFRAKQDDSVQDFRDFVAVSRFIKFLIVDNYAENNDSPTSFSSLAFHGLDAELKTFFTDLGLTHCDTQFIEAGFTTVASLVYLKPGDIHCIVNRPETAAIIETAIENLQKTYDYAVNQNIWWKQLPIENGAEGETLPPFSAYVDSGVQEEFILTAEGGCTIRGPVQVQSVCDPSNRQQPSVITFRNISISPVGRYLLQIRSVRNPSLVLSSFNAIEIGHSTLNDSKLDELYRGFAERLAFTQIKERR